MGLYQISTFLIPGSSNRVLNKTAASKCKLCMDRFEILTFRSLQFYLRKRGK